MEGIDLPNTIVKVQSIIDGDTVQVIGPKDGYIKVRLLGIDAPEIDQPYGEEARDHLKNMLPREVKMMSDKLDQYGRYSALLYSISRGSGPISYNEHMIRDGYATYEPNYGKIPNGREAQNYAKTNKLGMWRKGDILERPRTFRRRKNKKPVDYPIKRFPTTYEGCNVHIRPSSEPTLSRVLDPNTVDMTYDDFFNEGLGDMIELIDEGDYESYRELAGEHHRENFREDFVDTD